MVDVLPDAHIETEVLRLHAPNARCLVVGAYKGATMRYLLDHGAKHVTGFEPQTWACSEALANLAPLQYEGRYTLYNAALVPWEVSNDFPSRPIRILQYGTDGAKLDWMGPPLHVEMAAHESMNAQEFLHNEPAAFDLAVVNCEGAEYMLFPYLARRSHRMLVQFHGPAPMPCWPSLDERTFIGKGWWLYA